MRCTGRRRSSGTEADIVVWSGRDCTFSLHIKSSILLLVYFSLSLSIHTHMNECVGPNSLPLLSVANSSPVPYIDLDDHQVLDMVTDRMSTAGLLVLLTDAYPAPPDKGLCLLLIAVDIISHWCAMYASLQQQRSHKSLSAAKPWYTLSTTRSKRFRNVYASSDSGVNSSPSAMQSQALEDLLQQSDAHGVDVRVCGGLLSRVVSAVICSRLRVERERKRHL